jgi:hypothetical protein
VNDSSSRHERLHPNYFGEGLFAKYLYQPLKDEFNLNEEELRDFKKDFFTAFGPHIARRMRLEFSGESQIFRVMPAELQLDFLVKFDSLLFNINNASQYDKPKLYADRWRLRFSVALLSLGQLSENNKILLNEYIQHQCLPIEEGVLTIPKNINNMLDFFSKTLPVLPINNALLVRQTVLNQLLKDASKEALVAAREHPFFKEDKLAHTARVALNKLATNLFGRKKNVILTDAQKSITDRLQVLEREKGPSHRRPTEY